MTLPNELVDAFGVPVPIPSRVRGAEAERRVRGGNLVKEFGEGGARGEVGESEAYERVVREGDFGGTGGGGEDGGGGTGVCVGGKR